MHKSGLFHHAHKFLPMGKCLRGLLKPVIFLLSLGTSSQKRHDSRKILRKDFFDQGMIWVMGIHNTDNAAVFCYSDHLIYDMSPIRRIAQSKRNHNSVESPLCPREVRGKLHQPHNLFFGKAKEKRIQKESVPKIPECHMAYGQEPDRQQAKVEYLGLKGENIQFTGQDINHSRREQAAHNSP